MESCFVLLEEMPTIRCIQLLGQLLKLGTMSLGTGLLTFFVGILRLVLGMVGVFISDQQKGILDAVSNWAPEAEHRNYARHIYANWKRHFRNKKW